MAEVQSHVVPEFPWGQDLKDENLNTERGFVFQYPPFPAIKQNDSGRINYNDPLAIYFHMPFCSYRCSYCYYAISLNDTDEDTQRYIHNIMKEVDLVAERDGLSRYPETIFVGGGTPTFLSMRATESFLENVSQKFHTRDLLEFTFESDPTTVTLEKVKLLRKGGVNRMSLGVQTFSDDLNKINQRAHSRDETLNAVKAIYSGGIENLNLDIICGLTGETFENFQQTIRATIDINPEHVTMYLFSFRPQTIAYSKTNTSKIPLPPSESERIRMYIYARDQFIKSGYIQTTANCFIRSPNFEQIHQRNAWNSLPLIGFGNSAYSFTGESVRQNVRPAKKYNSLLEENSDATDIFHRLSYYEQMIRFVVLRLKQLSVPLNEFKSRFGFEFSDLFSEQVSNLEECGLINMEMDRLSLTDKGILYVDDVCRRFYSDDTIRSFTSDQSYANPTSLRASLV